MNHWTHLSSFIFCALLVLLTACSAPDIEDVQRQGPSAPITTDTDGDGWLDPIEKQVGTDHTVPSKMCNSTSDLREGEIVDEVDLIILVDNSASMSREVRTIFKSIFEQLIPAIEQAPLKANIILITDAEQFQRMCKGCDKNKVTLIDINISSFDALDKFIEHADLIKPVLHPTRLKLFALFSDDNAKIDAQTFDEALHSTYPTIFHKVGSFQDNYVFHSITGIDLPVKAGVRANQPIHKTICSTAINTGEVYQQLSKNTGGLRYSICNTQFRYDAIFTSIIGTVVDIGRIPCHINMPQPGNPQQKADPYKVGLQVTTPKTSYAVEQIASNDPCRNNAFFVIHNMNVSTIRLCPQLCQSLNEMEDATLQIATACINNDDCVPTSTQMTCN